MCALALDACDTGGACMALITALEMTCWVSGHATVNMIASFMLFASLCKHISECLGKDMEACQSGPFTF